VTRILANFQTEYRTLVTESDDIDLDHYCALTNSNIKFIANMRQFLESVKDMTGVPVEDLQKQFQQEFLMKNFAEISNTSYLRIQDLVKEQITEAFLSIRDYKSIVIVDWCYDSKTSWKTCS
jgi:hypothetical protein